MNPFNNRYELNPALHRDMPQDLFTDRGEINVLFTAQDYTNYPCLCHYEINGEDFTVDVSQMKDKWEEWMRDDIVYAIDRKFGNFFLSRKDLNLNIIGL